MQRVPYSFICVFITNCVSHKSTIQECLGRAGARLPARLDCFYHGNIVAGGKPGFNGTVVSLCPHQRADAPPHTELRALIYKEDGAPGIEIHPSHRAIMPPTPAHSNLDYAEFSVLRCLVFELGIIVHVKRTELSAYLSSKADD